MKCPGCYTGLTIKLCCIISCCFRDETTVTICGSNASEKIDAHCCGRFFCIFHKGEEIFCGKCGKCGNRLKYEDTCDSDISDTDN